MPNKRKQKSKGILYKGQYIEKNGSYTYGLQSNVVLFYCPIEGIELYFNSIGRAKAYLDSICIFGELPKRENNDIPF